MVCRRCRDFQKCQLVVTAREQVRDGKQISSLEYWRPRRDLNPCYRRERAMSWAGLDDGDAAKQFAANLQESCLEAASRPPRSHRSCRLPVEARNHSMLAAAL